MIPLGVYEEIQGREFMTIDVRLPKIDENPFQRAVGAARRAL